MNKREIETEIYTIREIKGQSVFTVEDFNSAIIERGYKSKLRYLIIRRSLMWGYIEKKQFNGTDCYQIIDRDKAVRKYTLNRGGHSQSNKTFEIMLSIREVYERSEFHKEEILVILKKCGYKLSEARSIYKRSLRMKYTEERDWCLKILI